MYKHCLLNNMPQYHKCSQVAIMVIGSDARTDAAEGDFENCRLLVDAAVYIWFLFHFSNQSTSLWLYKEPTVILNPPWQSSCPITSYRCLNIAWKEIGSHSHCCLPFWLAEGQWWWSRVILTPLTNKITQLRPIIIIVVYYRSHEVLPIHSLLFCVEIRSFCPKKKYNKTKQEWLKCFIVDNHILWIAHTRAHFLFNACNLFHM